MPNVPADRCGRPVPSSTRIADSQAWEPVADSAGFRSRSRPGWSMHWAGSSERYRSSSLRRRRQAHRRRAAFSCLLSFELRLLLCEKRLDSDLEVLGVVAGVGFVALALRDGARIREAPREFLVPARDQRRTLGDAERRRQRFFLDLVVGHDAVHQALVFRLLGAEHAAFEQDIERDGAADEIDQPFHLAVADHQPELRDRDAEAAGSAADTQVALRDDLQPSADAYAVDHRHDRVPASRDRAHRRLEHRAVLLREPRVPARGFEFGDVRAGGKGLVARAAYHDAAQALVGVELSNRLAQAFPRTQAERVELVRVAQRDGGDIAAAGEKDFPGHDLFPMLV